MAYKSFCDRCGKQIGYKKKVDFKIEIARESHIGLWHFGEAWYNHNYDLCENCTDDFMRWLGRPEIEQKEN